MAESNNTRAQLADALGRRNSGLRHTYEPHMDTDDLRTDTPMS